MSVSLAGAPQRPDVRCLPNGMPLALLSQPWSTQAAVCVRVSAGSHDEPLAYPGLAHFLEHLLFLDCAGFQGDQRLMPYVQACAGQVNATTQAGHTEFFFEVPAENLSGALNRLLDMLARPLLSETEQLRECEVVHAEFVARSQDSETLLACAVGQALACGHRGRDFVAGNRDTLPVNNAGFQQALRAFHQRFYHAGNCQLSIVGPQPVDELYALALSQAQVMPERPHQISTALNPLLPLRFHSARVYLPDEGQHLHVGYVLELPATQAADGLALLQGWLQEDQPNALLHTLRESGWAKALRVRTVYAESGQALLVLTLQDVTDQERALACVQDWLGFVAERVDLPALLDAYRQVQRWALASQGALALARCHARLADGEGGACELATLVLLLEQLQQAQRQVVIATQRDELPLWPDAVFPLRMEVCRPRPVPVLHRAWRVPGENLFVRSAVDMSPVQLPARLQWLPAPGDFPDPQAVWLARLSATQALGRELLLKLAESCLSGLQQQAEQVGVRLMLEAEADSVHLRIYGLAQLLPRVIECVLCQLLHPEESCWRLALAPATVRAGMPIRVLLAHCAELIEPSPALKLSKSQLQGRYTDLQLDALGVGFAEPDVRRINQLFTEVVEADRVCLPVGIEGTTHWRQISAEGEAALLLFCPQPDARAETEAGWRVLAQLHQSAFYQRLRSELQLGYAVFCQYRQIQGRRGLLFGVQSPHLSASAILEHIQVFLQTRTTWLEQLSEADVETACIALNRQWQVQRASVEGLAEQQWQARLAGLPADHDDAVQRTIRRLQRAQLYSAQLALVQGSGGRYVLSNHAQSA